MLKIENSCEIDDLISEVVNKTGKGYSQIEELFLATYLYPESNKIYLTTQFGPIVDDEWLNSVLLEIFKEANITEVYVTNAI